MLVLTKSAHASYFVGTCCIWLHDCRCVVYRVCHIWYLHRWIERYIGICLYAHARTYTRARKRKRTDVVKRLREKRRKKKRRGWQPGNFSFPLSLSRSLALAHPLTHTLSLACSLTLTRTDRALTNTGDKTTTGKLDLTASAADRKIAYEASPFIGVKP